MRKFLIKLFFSSKEREYFFTLLEDRIMYSTLSESRILQDSEIDEYKLKELFRK